MARTFSDGLITPPGFKRFHTLAFLMAAPQGNGTTGFVDLTFVTPETEPNHITCLSPEGVISLSIDLNTVISSMPTKPKIPAISLGGRVQGELSYGPTKKQYFGQYYELDIIQALGILTIRANLIDNALIDLMAAITGSSRDVMAAQYYATTNMNARIQSITAILEPSGLGEQEIEQIAEALDLVQRAASRRNDLVHGSWSERRGKFRVKVFKPTSKKKTVEHAISETFILSICESYYQAHTFVTVATQAAANCIRQSR